MINLDHHVPTSCPVARCELCGVELATLRIIGHIIDDLLECLECWHRLGYDEWKWVAEYWGNRVVPSIGVGLPAPVLAASDAAGVHRALLDWQSDVIDHLL